MRPILTVVAGVIVAVVVLWLILLVCFAILRPPGATLRDGVRIEPDALRLVHRLARDHGGRGREKSGHQGDQFRRRTRRGLKSTTQDTSQHQRPVPRGGEITAAEALELSSVPCLVRDFTDEADVVLSMLAENTQRSDGLNIVDEAQALAAVIDLRGGNVTARKLAAAVGHSEGWVRSRLALLTLPDPALDALHAGTITLEVATALTAVAEHSDLIEQLLAQRALTTWQIESAHRNLLSDLAVAHAASALAAAGSLAVTEDDWRSNQSTWKSLDSLGVNPDDHRAEPCHAVVVKCRYDSTIVEIPVCTEPRRHRGRKPDSELVVTATEPSSADRAATVERRERRLATEARSDWLSDRLRNGRHVATADAFSLAVATWIDSAPHAALQRAVKLLGIEHTDMGYVDYSAVLHGHLTAEPKRLNAVAVALTAAVAEERARQSLTSSTVARYLDAIERLGYHPTDWEHTQRLTTAA